MTDAIDKRLRSCPELIGLQQSGRLEPLPAYTAIAETSAAQVERTGRLGIATLCSGHQLVGQHFAGFASTARRAKWLGRTLPVAISERNVCADPKVLMTRAEPDNAKLVALPLLASAIMARLTTPDLSGNVADLLANMNATLAITRVGRLARQTDPGATAVRATRT